jgi:hypothetical protein
MAKILMFELMFDMAPSGAPGRFPMRATRVAK